MNEENTNGEKGAFYGGTIAGTIIGFIGGILTGFYIDNSNISEEVEQGTSISRIAYEDVDMDGRNDIVVYSTSGKYRPSIFLQREDGTFRKVEDVHAERLKRISAEVEKVRKMNNQELLDWYKNVDTKPEAEK